MARATYAGGATAAIGPVATLPVPSTTTSGLDLSTARRESEPPKWSVRISAAAESVVTNLRVYGLATDGVWERLTAPGVAVAFSSLTIPAGEAIGFILDDVTHSRLALAADTVSTSVSYLAYPLFERTR